MATMHNVPFSNACADDGGGGDGGGDGRIAEAVTAVTDGAVKPLASNANSKAAPMLDSAPAPLSAATTF